MSARLDQVRRVREAKRRRLDHKPTPFAAQVILVMAGMVLAGMILLLAFP